jgi:hypothetical protein
MDVKYYHLQPIRMLSQENVCSIIKGRRPLDPKIAVRKGRRDAIAKKATEKCSTIATMELHRTSKRAEDEISQNGNEKLQSCITANTTVFVVDTHRSAPFQSSFT